MKKEEKKEKEIHYEDSPDGGWGWMVVLHCFLVRLLLSSSLGVFGGLRDVYLLVTFLAFLEIIVDMLCNYTGLWSIWKVNQIPIPALK